MEINIQVRKKNYFLLTLFLLTDVMLRNNLMITISLLVM